MAYLGPSNLTFPMQPYLPWHAFRNVAFFVFLIRISPYFGMFAFLHHFSVYSMVLFCFVCLFVCLFFVFLCEIQDDRHSKLIEKKNLTSCKVINPFWGRQRQQDSTSKSHCHSANAVGVLRFSQGSETKIKPQAL